MVEFGEAENLLGVLMQGANYGDDGFIAETHHSAVFHIALRNPKIWKISLHLMHPLIFGYHPGQSLPPFEQSVC